MAIGLNERVMKSSFVQHVVDGDNAVVWHSLFGNPKIVSVETLEFLELFTMPTTINNQFGEALSREDLSAIDELEKSYFLVLEGFDDRAFLEQRKREKEHEIENGSLVNYLELIMSEACNFGCTYCIHFKNLGTSQRIRSHKKLMQFDTAQISIDNYLEVLAKNNKHVAEINFGGGEPLLVWPVIKQVLEYCTMVYGSRFDFRFSLNTNAALLTHEIAKTLKEYSVEIATSLDGLQTGNDRVRLTKGGQGTFMAIVNGLEILSDVGYPVTGFSVTVTEENFNEIDESVIDWAINHGMCQVRIDLDVIGMVGIPVDTITEKLVRLRKYASERGVDIPGFWSRPAENLNDSALENRVAFCGAVRGNSLCVAPSGDVYACGYSNICIGSALFSSQSFLPDTPYYLFVKNHGIGSLNMCKGCIIEGQCGGGCNITHEFAFATETVKIERMCDLYRHMTKEILREQLREASV